MGKKAEMRWLGYYAICMANDGPIAGGYVEIAKEDDDPEVAEWAGEVADLNRQMQTAR